MTRDRRLSVCIAVLAVVCTPAAPRAGEITGLVRDYVTAGPLDGVRVTVEGNPARTPVLTVNGRYRIDSLPKGKYKLSFDLTGYSPRPDDHLCDIARPVDAKQVDTELMRDDPALTKYYEAAGRRFVSLVKDDGGAKNHYVSRWHELRRFALHPSSRIAMAKSIDSADSRAREYLPLAKYKEASQGRIDALLRAFAPSVDALKVPDRALAEGLADDLVADIAIYALRKSASADKAKAAFVDAMRADWKGTDAADIVAAWKRRVEDARDDGPRDVAVDLKKLIGKWELSDDGNGKMSAEFAKAGKLTLTAQANGQEFKAGGTYKVDGKKLTTTLELGGQGKTETATILRLTDDELETEQEGRKVTFKRVKPK